MLMADQDLGLGIDVRGIHVISPGAGFRVATRSGTLADGLAQIQADRKCDPRMLTSNCASSRSNT